LNKPLKTPGIGPIIQRRPWEPGKTTGFGRLFIGRIKMEGIWD